MVFRVDIFVWWLGRHSRPCRPVGLSCAVKQVDLPVQEHRRTGCYLLLMRSDSWAFFSSYHTTWIYVLFCSCGSAIDLCREWNLPHRIVSVSFRVGCFFSSPKSLYRGSSCYWSSVSILLWCLSFLCSD